LSASTGAGFSALSNIQSAESAILQKQFEKQSKEKELIDAAVRDFNEYRMAKGRIAGLEQTIHASNNVMESYKRLFIAGKRQWLDLVNSSRELTQNKQSMADLRASMFSSSYQLTLKRGKLKLLSEGIQ
jgi:outer membrane protein, adhesin transport system